MPLSLSISSKWLQSQRKPSACLTRKGFFGGRQSLPQQFAPALENSGSLLEPFLQVMWTKMCCVCVIFPCNRLGCHYPHIHQTQGSGFNYYPPFLSLSLSLRLSEIGFEVFWLCSASHCVVSSIRRQHA